MGFMSLFSRKGKPDANKRPPSRLVKSHAYSNTVASLPPVKGTYPFPGNGRPFLDSLKFSNSQLSLAESKTPTSVVSRFRDTNTERPSTAPNGAQVPSERKEGPLKGPPVSFRKPTRLNPVHAETEAGRAGLQKRLPDIPPPSPASRLFSLKGDGVKASVDLLDAQSEFKPADFRTRVKAAGSRDYGEDVADRNIGENGVNLDSSRVQAFYATSVHTPETKPQRVEPARAGPRRIYSDNGGLYHAMARQLSMESGLHSKNLNSSHHSSFLQRPTTAAPQTSEAGTTQANTSRARAFRRQTLTTFAPSGSTSTVNTPQLRARPKSFHRAAAGALKDHAALYISPKRANRVATAAPGWDTTSPEPDSASPALNYPPRTPRSSVAVAERKTRAPARTELERPSSRSNSLVSFPEKRHSSRHSLGTIRPRTSHGVASDFNPLDYPMPKLRNPYSGGDIDGDDVAPSPSVKSGPSRADRDGIYGYPRTKSLLSSHFKSRLDELEDVPVRTSSLRHWSMTSATPTTSSSSSNLFPRPQSRHTANTSVDLTNTLSSIMNSSRSSLHSGLYQPAESFTTAPESCGNSPVKTPGFNIDDYLSSDDDSFTAPRRARGESEEGLLFNPDGFGLDGIQLPGLEDALAAPAPIVRQRSPRSSMSLPPGDLRHAYTSPQLGAGLFPPARHSRARKYIIDDSVANEPDDDRSYYYYSTDGDELLGRIPLAASQDRRAAVKRISALGSAYGSSGGGGHGFGGLGDDVIEEERLEKIDVATAVRMRKEAKARKRAMATGKRRGETLRGRRTNDEDEACHADVE